MSAPHYLLVHKEKPDDGDFMSLLLEVFCSIALVV